MINDKVTILIILIGYFTMLYLIYKIAYYIFRFVMSQIDITYQKRVYVQIFLKLVIILLVLFVLNFVLEQNININMLDGFICGLRDTLGERTLYSIAIFILLSLLGLILTFIKLNVEAIVFETEV